MVKEVLASKENMKVESLEQRVSGAFAAAKEIMAKVTKKSKTQEEPSKSTSTSTSTKKVAQQFYSSRHSSGGARISIPSGECPIIPQGYKKGWTDGPASDEVVKEWAISLYDFDGGLYSSTAVIYWIRSFWEINSPEYQRIRNLVKSTFNLT